MKSLKHYLELFAVVLHSRHRVAQYHLLRPAQPAVEHLVLEQVPHAVTMRTSDKLYPARMI